MMGTLSQKSIRVRGFSMPEVLLSMFVLSVGLMTIVAVMAGSLSSSHETRDAIVATGLALEGVEIVRNIRDNNIADGDDGFNVPTGGVYCRVDWNDPSDIANFCNNDPNWQTRYNLQFLGGRYTHINNTQERYARWLHLEVGGDAIDSWAIVTSYVIWDFSAGTFPDTPTECSVMKNCVYMETFLTSWRP